MRSGLGLGTEKGFTQKSGIGVVADGTGQLPLPLNPSSKILCLETIRGRALPAMDRADRTHLFRKPIGLDS